MRNVKQMTPIKQLMLATLFSGVGTIATCVNASNLDAALNSSKKKVDQNAQSQKKIDGIADKTHAVFDEFKSTEKLVEDLTVYNKKLGVQIDKQEQRLKDIEKSIMQVQSMQRQMMPLMENMIAQLENFIGLDLPFHIEEREERIAFLKNNLERPDLSTAEKFRQVLEAWQIENEYGRKIDTYPAKITINGNALDVQMLQVGRIALVYQTLDGSQTGAWNKSNNAWQSLSAGDYEKAIRQAIKIASKKANIDVMTIPVSQAEAF